MFPAAPYAAGASTALFSHFDYKGSDDYYAENPLTAPTQLYNPILPGWNSDPSICRTGSDYWLVTSTFGYFPGLPLYHSTDLVNWSLVRNVLDRHGAVRIDSMADSAVVIEARAWVLNKDYWDVLDSVTESFYKELPAAGARFPFPQLDVHIDRGA